MNLPRLKLADLANVCSGGGAPQEAEAFGAQGIPFVRAGSLVKLLQGRPEKDLELIHPDVASKYKLRLFPSGTVLFAKSGMSATKGHVYQLKKPAYVVNHLAALVPHVREDGNYLHHVLRYKSPTCLIKDEAYPSIRLGEIEEMEVPSPHDGNERRRIAAILDQADEVFRLRQRALAHLDKLSDAIFYKMFGNPKTNSSGWEKTTLGAVARFYAGNTLPVGKSFDGQQDGYLLLKVSDLNLPENTREIVRSAQWSGQQGSRAGTCPASAVVFPKRGGAIGTNKKRILARSAILDPNLMGVLPDENILHPDFLLAWFETFDLSDITSGSSVPQLNKQDLSPLVIYTPPFPLQERFAELMREFREIKSTAERYSLESRNLYISLQYRAFLGKL